MSLGICEIFNEHANDLSHWYANGCFFFKLLKQLKSDQFQILYMWQTPDLKDF